MPEESAARRGAAACAHSAITRTVQTGIRIDAAAKVWMRFMMAFPQRLGITRIKPWQINRFTESGKGDSGEVRRSYFLHFGTIFLDT